MGQILGTGQPLRDWKIIVVRDFMSGNLSVPNEVNSSTTSDEWLYSATVYYQSAQVGVSFALGALLLLCAVTSGLKLAICGIDRTWLRIRRSTGTPTQRKQAKVVAQLKHYPTWMLCSLILVSTASAQAFPYFLQAIWHTPRNWISLVVSTSLISLFGIALPQYMMSKNAITWGYYCSPLIWTCMVVTGIVTFPLAWFLETCVMGKGHKDFRSTFMSDELASLIKYHSRAVAKGGNVGSDAIRVMLGALHLDGRTISHDISSIPKSYHKTDSDVEKADLVTVRSLIKPWSAIKTIDINEPVNNDFIKKIKGYPYSRIPVVGYANPDAQSERFSTLSDWEGKEVFGFLHVKNLVGLDIKEEDDAETRLLVKDLPLFPLPIVPENMTAYDLLNLFQIGASRIVLVVPKPSPLEMSEKYLDAAARLQSRWLTTEHLTSAGIISNMIIESGENVDFATEFLEAVQAIKGDRTRVNVSGVRCPKPIGIVTFEDIMDAILQRSSRDEKEFYHLSDTNTFIKGRKLGDFMVSPKTQSLVDTEDIPHYAQPTYTSSQRSINSNIRKRHVSAKGKGPDLDGTNDGEPISRTSILKPHHESSYTNNSQGGFHGAEDCSKAPSESSPALFSDALLAKSDSRFLSFSFDGAIDLSHTGSLPSRKSASALLPNGFRQTSRRHASAAPRFPALRKVSTFSRKACSILDEAQEEQDFDKTFIFPPMSQLSAASPTTTESQRATDLALPLKELEDVPLTVLSGNIKDYDGGSESGETASLNSWSQGDDIFYSARPANSLPGEDCLNHSSLSPTRPTDKAMPYEGFPMELLDHTSDKENRAPDYASKTLPRRIGRSIDSDAFDTHLRDESFHDDRALLPSQRRALNSSMGVNAGARSSSLWF